MRKTILIIGVIFFFSSIAFADMRVCIEKSTGKLIESQSGGSTQEHLDTLTQNAINSGYNKKDIEVKYVTDAEYKAIIDAIPVPEWTKNEDKIKKQIRKNAIKELISKGELPEGYK